MERYLLLHFRSLHSSATFLAAAPLSPTMLACLSPTTLDVSPPRLTFIPQDALALLQRCASFNQFKQIHARIIRNGLHQDQLIITKLIRLCSSYSEVDYAALVFQQVEDPTTFAWNLLIRACSANGCSRRAILLFNLMICRGVGVDKFTFPFVMKACLDYACVEKAREVYGFAVKAGFRGDVYLDNVLMDLYLKCGVVDDGLKVFDKMRVRTVVSWTTAIAGLVHNGWMDFARKVFDEMPVRNVVSWTAMINGYARSNEPEKAFELFALMQRDGVKGTEYTVVSLLLACVELRSLKLGRLVHNFAIKNGFVDGVFVGTSLVDMYSKCGSLDDARRVFESVEVKNVAMWNTMITSLGVHRHGDEAMAVFEEMERANVKPDEVTLAGILCACLQMDDTGKGQKCFYYMIERYRIKPSTEHYACLFALCLQEVKSVELKSSPHLHPMEK